jgi:hypothetical protein
MTETNLFFAVAEIMFVNRKIDINLHFPMAKIRESVVCKLKVRRVS